MTDRPILFSAPMVRALLAGTKTQTRRLHKVAPGLEHLAGSVSPRIKAGDRLYVREHWRTGNGLDSIAPRDLPKSAIIIHEAERVEGDPLPGRFRQGMHMPKWASRITLHVTEVREQRLQDISVNDCMAEGIQSTEHWRPKDLNDRPFEEKWWDDATFWAEYPPLAYRALWETINGPGSWEKNPWVAAYTFTIEKANIDQARKS